MPIPSEKIEIIHPSVFPELELWSIYNSPRCFRFFHETYTVCSVADISGGRADWKYRRDSFSSFNHTLMLMEPGETHVINRVFGAATSEVVFIPAILFQNMAREMGLPKPPHFKTAMISSKEAYRVFRGFHSAIKRSLSSMEKEFHLSNCVSFLLKYCTEISSTEWASADPTIMYKIKEFIYNHFDEDITLSRLSSIIGISRFHLVRSFTQKFGLPPHAYQMQVRLAKARTQLSKGILPAHIDVGFADQSHFIRHFKKSIGVTPGQYAQMVKRPLVSFA